MSKTKIKVLTVNTYDTGGAAIACTRLHIGLLDLGVHSTLYLKFKNRNVEGSMIHNEIKTDLKRFLDKLIRITPKFISSRFKLSAEHNKFLYKRSKGLEFFSFPISQTDITASKEYQEADIVHLHWVSEFLDWETFFKKNKKPVVWTLHDQNPYLGGEHYSERYFGIDCIGLPIPRLKREFEISMENNLMNLKKSFLKNVDNLFIVANSDWNLENSKSSEVLGRFPHTKIDYGYPLDIFKPLDKSFSRSILNLDQDATIVLFAAASLANQRKGFGYAKRAFEILFSKYEFDNVICCTVGSDSLEIELKNCINLGRIDDDRIMALVYNAADVFIMPSIEEALGMVAVESILCGLPVIAFPTGGIPETIEHAVNGIICDEISVDALVSAVHQFLNGQVKFNRQLIADVAKAKYSLEKQAMSYIELYNKILIGNTTFFTGTIESII